MLITDAFLTINEYSRPGRKLKEIRAIILHWVGKGGQGARSVRQFFEDAPRNKHYSSAHYCIDLDGGILRLIPDDEVAYHCGSSQLDPVSGKIYTDWARQVFGRYAADPKNNSPNNAALGIELCVKDDKGSFTPETLQAARELTASLMKRYNVPIDRVGTHHLVVGWKDCPILWTQQPDLFEEFKRSIVEMLG